MSERTEREKPWWLLPVGRLHPGWWVAVGTAVVALDYAAGPSNQFPALYVIPVSLAAWYSGRWAALTLATAVPLFHLIFLVAAFPEAPNPGVLIAMTIVRGLVVFVMALWFVRLAEHERQLLRYVVKLEGMLPICSLCKSIRNEAGAWEPLESFLSQRSDADFSHGLCPTCLNKHYSPG